MKILHIQSQEGKTPFIHVRNFQVPKGKDTAASAPGFQDSWLPTQISFSFLPELGFKGDTSN